MDITGTAKHLVKAILSKFRPYSGEADTPASDSMAEWTPTVANATDHQTLVPPTLKGVDKIHQQADQPLADRLQQLSAPAGMGHKVAYLAENTASATFRYRAYNMAQLLNATHDHSAALFFLDEVMSAPQVASACTVLVISRARYDQRLGAWIDAVHAQGKAVVFDIDDLVFDTDLIGCLIQTQQQDLNDDAPWHYWYGVVARMADAIKRCNALLCSTTPLAEQAKARWPMPVWALANFMNHEQIEVSQSLFAEKGRLPAVGSVGQSSMVNLGYFSGSASHNGDFALIIPALEQLFQTHAAVRLVVVGELNCDALLQTWPDRVVRLPFMDYLELQRAIAQVDINLVPLQSNVFTHCKSDLKYFEAAAVGVPSVTSRVPVYEAAITQGVNGLYVDDDQWFDALHQLVTNPLLRRSMAQAAQADALMRHVGAAHLGTLLTVLEQVKRLPIASIRQATAS